MSFNRRHYLKGNKIDILDEFTESFTKKALREIAENIDCKPIKYLAIQAMYYIKITKKGENISVEYILN